jgi:hypothetical protein
MPPERRKILGRKRVKLCQAVKSFRSGRKIVLKVYEIHSPKRKQPLDAAKKESKKEIIIGKFNAKNEVEFFNAELPKNVSPAKARNYLHLDNEYFDADLLFKINVCDLNEGDSIKRFFSFEEKVDGSVTVLDLLANMHLTKADCKICPDCLNAYTKKYFWMGMGEVVEGVPFCVHNVDQNILYEREQQNLPRLSFKPEITYPLPNIEINATRTNSGFNDEEEMEDFEYEWEIPSADKALLDNLPPNAKVMVRISELDMDNNILETHDENRSFSLFRRSNFSFGAFS